METQTYFFDWEIRDENGGVVMWANTICEAGKDVPPMEVFKTELDNVRRELGISEGKHIRAITFNRV